MKPVIHTGTEPEIVSRITDLLISQKKKQSELMDYLGLHRNNFSEWKAGRNRSYLIYIDEIARYFEVSPTYLLRGVGDKDIINGSEEAQGIKNIEYNLADKVRELRAYLRLSRGVFAEPLGLSPTHIARFETGESIPTEGTITSICEAFGVDPRYFAADGHMAVEEAADFIDHSELIPDRLRSAREAKGWSQRELGKRSGVDVSIINRVEFGAKLTMKQGVKLAEVLEVGINWLMEGKDDRKKWPADAKLINWLWANEEVRRELWERMQSDSHTRAK